MSGANLTTHPRRGDVTARLVELDPRNAGFAARLAAGAGLDNVQIATRTGPARA
jgi:hypothetical protein